jgi:predicted flap endonuclease-1-like 5' DNA nuclease
MPKLIDVEGIGPKFAAALAGAGVKTTSALLKQAGSAKGRKALASATKIDEQKIVEWVSRADLIRVKGVGPEYAELLECAGVDSVTKLATRKPGELHRKILEVNAARKLVRRPPAAAAVQKWVACASALSATRNAPRMSFVEYLLSAPKVEGGIPLDRGAPAGHVPS